MAYTPPGTPPESLDETIWRYMDLPKFVSLLQNQALWFSTLASLQKIDPMEGTYPPEYLRKSYEVDYQDVRELTEAEHKHFRDNFREGVNDGRNVISCWHYSKHESQAMWKLYSNGSVAICSTPRRLRGALAINEGFRHLAMVNYTLYEEGQSWGHPEIAFFHKHKSLEHEQELRVLFQVYSPQNGGTFIPVRLEGLLESVWISPYADEWLIDVVSSLLTVYRLPSIKVFHSKLRYPPETL